MPLYRYLLGFYRVSVAKRDKTRFLNLIFTERLLAYEEPDGSFLLPFGYYKRLRLSAERAHISLRISEIQGLPRLFYAYRYRIGIPLGVMIAALLLFFGSSTVWRLEITGNERISSESIEATLAALDFGIGSSTRRESYEELTVASLLLNPDIAWMGIYTEGTTAHVRVIEREVPDEREESASGILVASDDALILRVSLSHGTAAVREGSVVKQGDTLAHGVVSGAHEDSLLDVQGEVIGRVTKEFSVDIPYEQQQKVETARQTEQFSLIFFRKPLFFFKKTNKNESNYVIINRKEYFSLFGTRLPFGYEVTEAILYKEVTSRLTPAEAIREGMEALEAEIRLAVGEGELLCRRVRLEETDSGCRLYATVEYTKNIAVGLPLVRE